MMGQNNLLALADDDAGQNAADGENGEAGGTSISEEDTRTEIWRTSKPNIARTYDGTTNGNMITLGTLDFTDDKKSYRLTEGTDFTATKTFDSADAGDHKVTVEITLIDEAAKKYKLKAGTETFTIDGTIYEATPNLTVSLSQTTCAVGETLPLVTSGGAPEGAEVTYYYTMYKDSIYSDDLDVLNEKIDENTTIPEEGTYYIFARSTATKNYKAGTSEPVELTVTEPAASVTKADGTVSGTYKTLPAALNAAQNGDTVKLLADHVADADALNALGEDFTFEQYASIVPVVTKTLTLDLNHKTVDYLEVGFTETNEETQEKETFATGNLTVTSEATYGRILNLVFMAGALDIRGGEIGGSEGKGLVCDVNSGTAATISGGTVLGLTVLEGATVTVENGFNHRGRWSVDSGGTLSITGGTFKDVQFVNSGTIAISGGTFEEISNNDTNTPQPLMLLLAKDCAFVNKNNTSDVQDGTKTSLTEVMVKEHTHTFENGKCACGVKAIVTDNNVNYYSTLQAALDAAANDNTITTVTLQQDLAGEEVKFRRAAAGALTLNMNGHKLEATAGVPLTVIGGELIIEGAGQVNQNTSSNAAAFPAISLTGGKLVITGDLTAQGGYDSSNGRKPAIRAEEEGELDLQGNVSLNGGLTMLGNAKLTNLLTKGTFYAQDPNGNATADNVLAVFVQQEDVASDNYNTVLKLIADGYAIYKKDGTVRNAAALTLKSDTYTIKSHTCSYTQDETHGIAYCNCGRSHAHRDLSEEKSVLVNGICPICGYHCPHKNIGDDGVCKDCNAKMVAKVTVGETTTFTADLADALNKAANDTTIKLLANAMLPDGIYVSKTLTLDLNGHSLSGYSLNVGGLTPTGQVRTGNLTVIDSSGGNGAVGVTVRDGGTLVFDPENDSTTLLQLEVWGGTVELYSGRILRKGLQLNNSIVLGDLLPRKAGLAYYREGSDTQLTLKEAASKTCDLVVKSCAHGGKNGFDENATACPYCNAPAVAEAALNDGEGGRLRRRFTNLQTAIDADRDGGATLQLLADVTGDYTIDGTQDTGLNLNGHCIKGTVTVKAATGNNTTTFSNTQNNTTASIDAVVAHRGAKLAGTGYPAVIGKLTLADTTKWKDILQQPTRLGFRVTNADGTHKWYAPDDVNGSQLNNVIINSLPITTKTLNLKVDGKNLTGNSPKVERGTTVQLCAGCNGKGADVYIYIGENVGNNNPTYSQKKAEYKKIGSSWYYVVDLYANTIGTYDIYFTASKDGYSVTSSHKKLTVIKAATPDSAITAPVANALIYNGNEQVLVTAGSVEATYGEMQYRLGTSGGFSTDIPTATDAGTYTVYYKVVGAEGYDDTTAKSIKVTISPVKIKGIGNVASVSKTYDGSASVTLPKTNLAFLGAAGSMISIPGSVYRITDARFTTRQDDFIYADSPDAGTKEAISFTLTLTDSNYVFEGKAASVRSANFNFTSKDDRFKINQATVTPAEITLYVYNDVAKTYTLNLATLLPKLTPGCEYGKIKYQGCDYHFTDSTYLDSNNGMFVSNEGVLTLPIVAAHSAGVNKQIGKITAPVVAANYQQFELTIKVVIGEKITPVKSDDFKISATGIIYRQTLENSRLTVEGTMKDPTTGKEVKGTFAWLNKYDIPSRTGDCYVDWIFTPAEGYEKYAAVTGIVKVPVAPKSINGATITLEKYEFAYNAAEQSPKITGVTLENWDETRITYVIKSGDKATDANDSIPLTIEGTGNYTGKATVKWKITPKEVTPTMEVASCTYTGDALEPTVTVKDDTGNIIDPKEYEIFYSNNTNVGTATVTVKDVEGGNYVLSEAGKTFEITKAAAPAAEAGSLTITNGLHKTYSLDLSTLLPKLTAPCDYGEIIYDKKVDTALGIGTFVTLVNGKTGELTLEANRSGTDEGQFGTITVTISTSNYQDITLTINVSAKNRLTPVLIGTPTLTPTELTYGESLSKIKITGTMKAGDGR